MPTAGCRFCRGEVGDVVLDLGRQPACEYFPRLDGPGPAADPIMELRLWLCAGCGLAQLADDAELPEEPVGVEPAALVEQRAAAVAAVTAAGLLPAGGTVVEGASPHGGSWLPELAASGVVAAAPDERADVVVDGAFGLMHAPDQAAALDVLLASLAPDGLVLFQFHSLAAIVEGRQWNAIRHGHHAYYSTPVAVGMLADRGLTVTHAWRFPLYGGTVLVAARRAGAAGPVDASVADIVASEEATGVRDAGVLRGLQHAVEGSTAALRALLDDAVRAGAVVRGYSAASRAVALLYLAGIDERQLPAVVDASPAKQGCRMPGTRIPVVGPDELAWVSPGTVLLFVPDLLPEVRRVLPQVEAAGGRWVVIR